MTREELVPIVLAIGGFVATTAKRIAISASLMGGGFVVGDVAQMSAAAIADPPGWSESAGAPDGGELSCLIP